MSIKLLKLFLLVIISIQVQSQELQYRRGGKIPYYDKSFNFYGTDSTMLYATYSKSNQYFIQSFDKNSLASISTIKIPLPSKDTTNYSLEGLFLRQDTFQIFYSYHNFLKDVRKLEMITFHRNGLLIGDKVLVDEQVGKKADRTSFMVYRREYEREYITIGYNLYKDTTWISIDHFEYSGQKKHSQNFFSLSTLTDFSMDEECNAYYLTSKKIKRKIFKWSVQIYSPGSDSVVSIDLPKLSMGDVFLSQYSRTAFKNGVLNYYIPYSKEGGYNAEGIYFAQIDCKTQKLLREETIQFKPGTEENNPFEMTSCFLINIVFTHDKNVKLVFESRSSTTSTVYGIPVETDYTIGNILTIDIDSNCTVTEFHNLKKLQIARTPKFMYTGFATFYKEGLCYFLYNELPENLNKSAKEMKKVNMSKIDETNVICTFVNEDGNVKRSILIDKGTEPGIDAIIPGSFYSDQESKKLYIVRLIKDEAELIEIY